MSDLSAPAKGAILFAEECDSATSGQENRNSVLHARMDIGDLLIVADGIDEDGGGALASRMAVADFYAHLATLPYNYPADTALREAAAFANENMIVAANGPGSQHLRLGSTLVAALMQQDAEGTCAWVGHIGNSRAYVVRARRLYRLTVDHTVAQSMLSRSLIEPEDVETHPNAEVLTRCMGHQPEVEIDIELHNIGVDDTLILCSHGLWRSLSDTAIEKEAIDPTRPVQEIAHNLLEKARAAGSREDIGIEVARLILPLAIPDQIEKRSPFKLLLAIFVLALASLCALAWFAFFR